MKEPFDPKILALLAKANTVRIETRRGPRAPVHQTPIWVVVDGEDVYVRSFTGRTGRWYREIRANPQGVLLKAGERIPFRAVQVRAPVAISRASKGYLTKYAKSPYAKAMVKREILSTTLRLEASHH
jgi:hypothetical protein